MSERRSEEQASFNLRLPRELLEELRACARDQDRSANQLLNVLIKREVRSWRRRTERTKKEES